MASQLEAAFTPQGIRLHYSDSSPKVDFLLLVATMVVLGQMHTLIRQKDLLVLLLSGATGFVPGAWTHTGWALALGMNSSNAP